MSKKLAQRKRGSGDGDGEMVKLTTPITVLVAAVGGQGGQLFSQWLFDAAKEAGFYPTGVGLPGLSQREGATVYYLEFFAEPEATALFSPFPEKGKVQVLIGLELLELLRAVREGYLAEDGVIIGSTHRVLTTDEKLPIWGNFVTSEQVLPILRQRSKQCVAFDAVQAAKLAGLSELAANAILFGALASSGALPFPVEAFRRAIEHYGIAVSFNLRAFEFGSRYREWLPQLQKLDDFATQEWESLPEPKLPTELQRELEALSIDDELAKILRHAAKWLCHYQDARYFARYLDCVRAIYERENGQGTKEGLLVTKEVARILATRMAYEDAIRVAQLKTQRQRFERLKKEHQIGNETVYRVVDFFSPDWDELTGLLPFGGARGEGEGTRNEESELPELPSQSEELKRASLQMKIETSSLTGYLLLKVLQLLKPLRPYSRRFKREWAAINEWIEAVKQAIDKDYDLAFLVARSGELVRGYGRTRRKTLALWRTFAAFLNALEKRGMKVSEVVDLGEQFLSLAMSGPEGAEKAWLFAKERLGN
ncbi:MAG: indolepyruvate oxidoreductase subunit beta family protein [Armatimonadetes bacterium]|nr:indolepyruvate oxidoreductase subunit beta family protein [Armatimonadota bacterium]